MGFSTKQSRALRRDLDGRHVRVREANGRELSYIEGWFAISEANRIFGFDSWNRETVESRCVLIRENHGTFLAVYIARIRVTVHADGTTVIREKHEGHRRVKSMILRSRLLKPMRPNEPWRLSVVALALNFIARVKLHPPQPPYPRPQKTVAPSFLDFLLTIAVSEVHLSLAKKLAAPITPQRKPNRFRQRCPLWRQLESIKVL
jgi:Rad52/22 family double-strand break repair protein